MPEYAVVVPGALPGKPLKNGQPGPSTACAVIVKRVDERTRSKTGINAAAAGLSLPETAHEPGDAAVQLSGQAQSD